MNSSILTRLAGLLMLAGLLPACEGVLDKQPQSSVSLEEAITDAAGARAAILGAYASLATGYGQSYTVYPDLLADNLAHTGSLTDLDQFKNHEILPTNGSVSSLWQLHYQGINRVNYVLAKVSLLSETAFADQKRILAEAKFIRALLYFQLVRYWGDVPVITTPTQTARICW